MKQQSTTKNVALKLCVTAMFSALILGGKEALAAIPNVEVVTIFVAVCASVWGLSVAIPAVCAFVLCDMAIWGVNTWIISYIIHWNVIALAFWGLAKLRPKNKAVYVLVSTVTAITLTALFGVLTSAVDTAIGFVGGFFFDFQNFAQRFSVMYVAGFPFYVTHVVCNAALFATAYLPLTELNRRAKLRMFGE